MYFAIRKTARLSATYTAASLYNARFAGVKKKLRANLTTRRHGVWSDVLNPDISEHGVRRSASADRPEDAPALISRIQLPEVHPTGLMRQGRARGELLARFALQGYPSPTIAGQRLFGELTARG